MFFKQFLINFKLISLNDQTFLTIIKMFSNHLT